MLLGNARLYTIEYKDLFIFKYPASYISILFKLMSFKQHSGCILYVEDPLARGRDFERRSHVSPSRSEKAFILLVAPITYQWEAFCVKLVMRQIETQVTDVLLHIYIPGDDAVFDVRLSILCPRIKDCCKFHKIDMPCWSFHIYVRCVC